MASNFTLPRNRTAPRTTLAFSQPMATGRISVQPSRKTPSQCDTSLRAIPPIQASRREPTFTLDRWQPANAVRPGPVLANRHQGGGRTATTSYRQDPDGSTLPPTRYRSTLNRCHAAGSAELVYLNTPHKMANRPTTRKRIAGAGGRPIN